MAARGDTYDRSRFAGRVAVVTGGCGFIGSAIVRALVAAKAVVRVVDAMMPGTGANAANLASHAGQFEFCQGDCSDIGGWRSLLDHASFVFHLAGHTSHAGSMAAPEQDLVCNQISTLRLLDACRHHAPAARIVLAGTRQVYGRPQYLPVDEVHRLAPPDANAVHKLAAERYLEIFSRAYGLAGTVLRLTNTYGPGMRIRDDRQMFLGIWIRCLIEDRPFEIWGREVLRDFTYVDDCADAFLRAATSKVAKGRTYNLGADQPVAIGTLADMLVSLNGGGRNVVRAIPADRRPIDIGDYYADWSRIGSDLGWRPRTPLGDGLRRTLEWYRDHAGAYL